MRDPFTWSLSLGRWAGVRVRVHLFFLIFVVIILIRQGGLVGDGPSQLGLASLLVGVLFVSVLLHEFGHCFAARFVGGRAEEIVMWPLGGLAVVEVANTPRAQFVTTVGGPAVNLLFVTGSALFLGNSALGILANPFQSPIDLYLDLALGGTAVLGTVGMVLHLNWILLLFNLLPAFPLDGGRLLRCVLWRYTGFGQATKWAVQTGKISAIALFIFALATYNGSASDFILLGVAIFIFVMAERERQMLESGLLFDDSVFGYDFSQGYTSLEREAAQKPRRPSAWRRWRDRRAQLRQERELAQHREEERQTDEILAKLHRDGMQSLSEDEKRFLTRISTRYRNRLGSKN